MADGEGARKHPRHRKKRRKRRSKHNIGAVPGAFVVDPEAPPTQVRAIAYGPDALRDLDRVTDFADIDLVDGESVLWLDIVGLGTAETLQAVADRFDIHPLALEDVVHTHQRPKTDHYPSMTLVIVRMPSGGGTDVETEQLSVVLGEGFVITFQERPGDTFDSVRDRIRRSRGRIRRVEADYLAYALLDAVVDGYFPVLEAFGDRLDGLEDEAIMNPGPETVSKLHAARRETVALRRAIWPMREALQSLMREDETERIHDDTRLYLRDAHDHCIRVLDLIESYRETASSLMDVYLSSVSNRMNEVMQVLTIIATIFIPLTFVAGVYGMNFDPAASPYNMPELGWRYGYPVFWGLIIVLAILLLIYFRRRGWLGRPSAEWERTRRERAGE